MSNFCKVFTTRSHASANVLVLRSRMFTFHKAFKALGTGLQLEMYGEICGSFRNWPDLVVERCHRINHQNRVDENLFESSNQNDVSDIWCWKGRKRATIAGCIIIIPRFTGKDISGLTLSLFAMPLQATASFKVFTLRRLKHLIFVATVRIKWKCIKWHAIFGSI